jgi:hypothetical protein
VAGVVGFELRCAQRKFISLRCRVSSDSGDPAETAAVPRENDLLRWGWTVFLTAVAVSPTLRTAHRAVALHHIKVRIISPRQVGYELRSGFSSFKLHLGAMLKALKPSRRLRSPYRSGPHTALVKVRNPASHAAQRERSENWNR